MLNIAGVSDKHDEEVEKPLPEQIDIRNRLDKNPDADSCISDNDFDFEYEEVTDEPSEIIICQLKQGHYFGELGLTRESCKEKEPERVVSAWAKSNVHLLKLSRFWYLKLLEN